MRQQIKLTQSASRASKIGVDEIEGLGEVLESLLKPVQARLLDHVYWNDCAIGHVEYRSRDGFWAHSHNCGGRQISLLIPKCECCSFSFLEFGECDECGKVDEYPDGDYMCGYGGVECVQESDGHLDASLRVWLKFEGIDDDGGLQFYLYCGGGNGDAPYFRTKHEATVFEASFSCKSVAGVKRAAAKHVAKLLKTIGAK